MTRGEKVIAFIEKYCFVPEGKLVGKPIKLLPFQKKFILDVYDNPHGTRRGILSIARKNGKTAIMACLILCHLVGSEAKQNSQIVSGAMSRDQAALVFDLACKIILQNPDLSKLIRIIPSKKTFIGLPMNVTYTALAADGKTAQGLSPIFALIDEAGQVVGSNSPFISAIETSQGAHDNPMLMYISTQAANDSDYLSLIIDDIMNNNDKQAVCHLYCADNDANLADEEQWKKANPALGVFRSKEDVKSQAEKASRLPSAENTFRNLILNQRVSIKSPFINKNTWLACKGDLPEIIECEAVYGGLDLSAKTDLTSLVLAGTIEDKIYLYPYAWTPSEGLYDRVTRDKAPYDRWVEMGYIETTPGASISYDFIATRLAEIVEDCPNLVSIAYDRWRIDVLKNELERIGVELPLESWGQGFKDMSPAVEAMEGALLNKKLIHNDNPVLNMCANNTTLIKNPAGDRKPDKMKTSGRIDVMVASIMAVGLAERKGQVSGDLDIFLSNPLII